MNAQQTIARLQADIDFLEEQIVALKSEFAETEWEPDREKIWLTPMEITYCQLLLKRKFVTAEQFLSYAYQGKDEPEDNIVRVYVSKLRKKIKPFGIVIKTVWGVGFQIDSESQMKLKELGK